MDTQGNSLPLLIHVIATCVIVERRSKLWLRVSSNNYHLGYFILLDFLMKDGIQSAVFTNNFDCKTIIVEELVSCIQSQLVVVDICYLTF